MPYNFTSLGPDDITFGTTVTAFADNRAQFISGWFKSTSLTATERLWSFVNNSLAFEPSDVLRFRSTNATTNGAWDFASCGFVADEWRFVAYLGSTENTGVLNPGRLWTGSVTTAPEERTRSTITTPVGNFTGSASFYIGNQGTAGALSFGGQIADVSVIVTDAAYGVTTHPFGLATTGVITNEEALHVYQTLVLPLWLGDTSVLWDGNRPMLSTALHHLSLNVGDRVVGTIRGGTAIMPLPTITYNTATSSQVGAPRPRMGPAMLPNRRR